MTIINHVEKIFGGIERGWSFEYESHSYNIVECEGGRLEGVSTYCTLGLSRAVLQIGRGREISHEILISVEEDSVPGNVAALISQVVEQILAKHEPLKNDQVLRRSGVLFKGREFNSFWVKSPFFFGEDAEIYESDDVGGGVCIIVWLVPIFESEARYIELRGGEAFEDILTDLEVDFFSLDRRAVV
ncbi:suppressor of fused domain protein [Pseudomonas entomophila]|uniref:suppressor of fused domain protein n=1 Tax=Pseudomonas entomophila TaxID=312306 RepID=UPI00200C4031|nr:suppressor of fused domain protein [Pseudomonas entomophila]